MNLTKIQGVEAQNLESLNFVKRFKEKEELLKEYDKTLEKDINLDFKALLLAFFIFFSSLLLFIPKVLVGNIIYQKSLHIDKMEKELKFLQRQSKKISQQIDLIKYTIVVP